MEGYDGAIDAAVRPQWERIKENILDPMGSHGVVIEWTRDEKDRGSRTIEEVEEELKGAFCFLNFRVEAKPENRIAVHMLPWGGDEEDQLGKLIRSITSVTKSSSTAK